MKRKTDIDFETRCKKFSTAIEKSLEIEGMIFDSNGDFVINY